MNAYFESFERLVLGYALDDVQELLELNLKLLSVKIHRAKHQLLQISPDLKVLLIKYTLIDPQLPNPPRAIPQESRPASIPKRVSQYKPLQLKPHLAILHLVYKSDRITTASNTTKRLGPSHNPEALTSILSHTSNLKLSKCFVLVEHAVEQCDDGLAIAGEVEQAKGGDLEGEGGGERRGS